MRTLELSNNLQDIKHASDEECMAMSGTDLSKYESIENRTHHKALKADKSREIYVPIIKSFVCRLTNQVASPSMLTHIVTTRCNFGCGFCCFADTLNAKTDELTLEEIKQTYASIGSNLNTIVYSGGETTLNKDLPDIIESAYLLTPVKSVYIISNAWKPDLIFEITHRIKQACPDLHLTWSLSIEGPKETNNSVRYTRKGGGDAWQNSVDTMWGIKKIRKLFNYSQLDVQLCTVCSPNNVDVLDDWYIMVRDMLRPDKWNLNLLRKSVQMTGHQLMSWQERKKSGSLESFEQKYLEITERIYSDVLKGKLKFLYHTNHSMDGAIKSAVDLISQADNRRIIKGELPDIKCRAGINGAYIGSDGEVSACEEFANNPSQSKSFGNLRDCNFDFQAIWHSVKANQHRKLVNKALECQGCTLESQRNYPSILVSLKHLIQAGRLAKKIR